MRDASAVSELRMVATSLLGKWYAADEQHERKQACAPPAAAPPRPPNPIFDLLPKFQSA